MMVVFSHISLAFFPYLHNLEKVSIPDVNGVQYFIHHSPFSFFFSGTSAVYIFFVLSGIVLSRSMEKKDRLGYVDSFISRYPRLMIPALVSCLISFFIFEYLITSWSIGLTPWFNRMYVDASLLDAIYNGTIKPFFLNGSSYNNVLWTMKIELLGSFLIYIFSYSSRKIDQKANCLLFLLLSLCAYAIETRLSLGFLCFWFGFTVYNFNIKIRSNYMGYFLLFLGLYLAGAHNESMSYGIIANLLGNKTYGICNLLSGFIIVWVVFSNENIQRALNKDYLVKLGKLSFSIYLIHLSVIILVCYFFYNNLLGYFSYNVTSIILSGLIVFLTVILSKPMSKIDDLAVKFSKSCCVFSKKGRLKESKSLL
ncbi:acyltransferase family protein [Vibrio sp. Isolate30]|nr:acyltransferase family protein [Vibrio sp. Isolate30]